MKIFNQERWNLLPNELKVAVACRYCAIPYFSNLIVQTRLNRDVVHLMLDRLEDMGDIEESWQVVGGRWVKVFKYAGNLEYIDMIIKELA